MAIGSIIILKLIFQFCKLWNWFWRWNVEALEWEYQTLTFPFFSWSSFHSKSWCQPLYSKFPLEDIGMRSTLQIVQYNHYLFKPNNLINEIWTLTLKLKIIINWNMNISSLSKISIVLWCNENHIHIKIIFISKILYNSKTWFCLKLKSVIHVIFWFSIKKKVSIIVWKNSKIYIWVFQGVTKTNS
jgi:hypothetical protein